MARINSNWYTKGKFDRKNWINTPVNVSADVIGFKPISLKELLKKVEEKK